VVGILTPLRCYYRQDPHPDAVHVTSRSHFHPRRAPSYRIGLLLFGLPKVSAASLSPANFWGP